MERTVKPFSAGYFILDANVVEFGSERVVVPHDYFGELTNYVTLPLLRISGEHRWAEPEKRLPAKTVAVPKGLAPEEGEPVLMAKDSMAKRLVETGEHPRPA